MKFFWDLLATIFGIFLAWKTFLFLGEKIPMFGYFPIGLIGGLLALGIGAKIIYLVELLFYYLFFKTTGIRLENNLPF